MREVQKQVSHYTAVFEEDMEQGGFTVTIPQLPGCISEGKTFEEAERNILEAAELYLEDVPSQDRDFSKRRVILAGVDILA
ncbi:MAG: type II toxin-antitoxin system HicB family antitoxin [Candidatus Uhrbacteria bacterium]|nr:type II toxin-antitoxin system HicB family antitoxin [Candidatus Uhrbacteria bacterium]